MTTLPALAAIPVTDDDALTQRWADLLPPGPVGARTLWLAWLRPDGTMLPVLVPIERMPERARSKDLRNLVDLHAEVAGLQGVDPDELHLTMTLERPGRISSGFDDADDEWCEVVDEEVAQWLEQGCTFHVFDGRSALQLLPREQWPR
jgi:hypothetical protein